MSIQTRLLKNSEPSRASSDELSKTIACEAKVNDTGDDYPDLVKRVLKRMAWKIVRQNKFVLGDIYQAQQDILQAGCLAYWRYKESNYFPIKSIRYFMLNELANICWESSWQGKMTTKRLPTVPLEDVNEFELPKLDDLESRVDRVVNYQKLVEAAKKSDAGGVKSGQRTKHMRTLRLFAKHGMTCKGERGSLPDDIDGGTYWYACKSLKNFALKTHGLWR